MNILKMLVALLTMFSTSLFAFEINVPRTWGYEIKCDNESLLDIKQVDGRWLDPIRGNLFLTVEDAATFACYENEIILSIDFNAKNLGKAALAK